MHFVPVDVEARSFQLTAKCYFPSSRLVERVINNATKVRRDLKVAALKGADTTPAEASDKVAEFQKNILPGSGLKVAIFYATDVIRREEDHCETNIPVCLDLLNDG